MASQGIIELGPWGGSGGGKWDLNYGSNAAIKDIRICTGDFVDSVTFTSVNRTTGETIATTKFGGSDSQPKQILIDWPREYLTLISGTIVNHAGFSVIESLAFHTNRSIYGRYGKTSGSTFKIPMENGEIVGFFGRAGGALDAIGIYVKPSAN